MLLCPSPRAPRKLPGPRVRLSVRDHSGTVRPRIPPNPRSSQWKALEARRAETFFFLQQGWRWLTPGSLRSPSAPASRLEAVSPPAGLGARTGGSPGTAGPARLQAVGEAGGRAPRGREQTGPRPGSAVVAVGASRGGAGSAGGSLNFRWVDGEGNINHKGGRLRWPFPASPQLGPGSSCSGRLWRLFLLSPLSCPTAAPSGLVLPPWRTRSPPEHPRSQLSQQDPPSWASQQSWGPRGQDPWTRPGHEKVIVLLLPTGGS